METKLHNIELNKEEIEEILFSLKTVNDITTLKSKLITNLINKLYENLGSER